MGISENNQLVNQILKLLRADGSGLLVLGIHVIPILIRAHNEKMQ
jgi:hypothetical protein